MKKHVYGSSPLPPAQSASGTGPISNKVDRTRDERVLPAKSEVYVDSAGWRIYYKATPVQQQQTISTGVRNPNRPILRLLAYKSDRVVQIPEGSQALGKAHVYRAGSPGEMPLSFSWDHLLCVSAESGHCFVEVHREPIQPTRSHRSVKGLLTRFF